MGWIDPACPRAGEECSCCMLVWRRGGALLPRASRRLHSPGAAEVFMPAWRGRGTRPSVSRGSGRGPGACSARKHRGSANGCGRSTRRPRSATHQSSTATPCRHRPRRNRHERREPTSASPERQSPAGHRAGRSQRRPNATPRRRGACRRGASRVSPAPRRRGVAFVSRGGPMPDDVIAQDELRQS